MQFLFFIYIHCTNSHTWSICTSCMSQIKKVCWRYMQSRFVWINIKIGKCKNIYYNKMVATTVKVNYAWYMLMIDLRCACCHWFVVVDAVMLLLLLLFFFNIFFNWARNCRWMTNKSVDLETFRAIYCTKTQNKTKRNETGWLQNEHENFQLRTHFPDNNWLVLFVCIFSLRVHEM